MTDAADLPPEEPYPGEDLTSETLEPDGGLIDRMRGTGVGVEDPNVVGDLGPAEIAPGTDSE